MWLDDRPILRLIMDIALMSLYIIFLFVMLDSKYTVLICFIIVGMILIFLSCDFENDELMPGEVQRWLFIIGTLLLIILSFIVWYNGRAVADSAHKVEGVVGSLQVSMLPFLASFVFMSWSFKGQIDRNTPCIWISCFVVHFILGFFECTQQAGYNFAIGLTIAEMILFIILRIIWGSAFE